MDNGYGRHGSTGKGAVQKLQASAISCCPYTCCLPESHSLIVRVVMVPSHGLLDLSCGVGPRVADSQYDGIGLRERGNVVATDLE